ncbi:carbohydrate porin [Phreatobacter sp.]|uniref:carbohydrate porin n=1 Tax=Phreatobacter sp. TaxID=1966341 RepID=UPI0022CC619E|nr:carbohydrate porin [Phreatobacter sp.]MCZ8313760.1 carbohydrate porin [Phreatobacter sp.]
MRDIFRGAGALALTSGLLLGAAATLRPAMADQPEYNGAGVPVPSIATSLPSDGDPSGTRRWLAERGINWNLLYTNDVLGNAVGGLRRGVINQGKLEAAMQADLEKLMGLQGLTFYSNVFFIHNTGRIRRDYVGGLNTIAAIEAVPTIRLSELWLEQKFAGGAASVRVGQLAADTEFFFSAMSALMLQSDWATIAAANLQSGGPAYPLSTPGVRLKIDPTPNWSLLFAIFNGNPAGPGAGDEQLRNRYGLNFRVTDPALLMAEAQWRQNRAPTDTGLATTIKLGTWAHLGRFNDQRFANDGTLIANPTGSGVPLSRRGNWGLYAVVDQQIYRPQGGDADSGVSLYGRVSFSPGDRNLIGFFADGGIIFSGMIPHRPDDKFGFGIDYSRFSDRARAFDRDVAIFTGLPTVIRDYELNLEFTYQALVRPGLTVQPVLTYVIHPNGDPGRNALVGGIRTMVRF